MDTVESIAADPRFVWKTAKKTVRFICLLCTHEYCRSEKSGGGLLRKASGTLANRTLKPSKVLVTNSGDGASEAIGEIQDFRVLKVPTARRMILNFGDESATCLSRNVVSGGPQLVVELPMTVQLPGGVTVTVLRDNLCCNERLGGKASAWKPRAETEPGLQPSGSKTGNGPTTDGNRATNSSELVETDLHGQNRIGK